MLLYMLILVLLLLLLRYIFAAVGGFVIGGLKTRILAFKDLVVFGGSHVFDACSKR